MTGDAALPVAKESSGLTVDPWSELRGFTAARIALNRAGSSLPTDEVLAFSLAHAKARDAVHAALNVEALAARLAELGLSSLQTHSRATSRATYLRRPDLGRSLANDEREKLKQSATGGYDICIVVADGLSAAAVQANAPELLRHLAPALRKAGRTLSPAVLVSQGRVAIGDEIGALLNARVTLMLIGERPGLSSADSLGAYLTYAPGPDRSDADRNCISNIRPEGLLPKSAALKAEWLIDKMFEKGISGVALKEISETEPVNLRVGDGCVETRGLS
jgi:ethanolamine ammonia-lyase small subunit